MVKWKITGGLKLVSRYQPHLNLNSDVDQATYMFGFAWKIPNLSTNRLQVHINQDIKRW